MKGFISKAKEFVKENGDVIVFTGCITAVSAGFMVLSYLCGQNEAENRIQHNLRVLSENGVIKYFNPKTNEQCLTEEDFDKVMDMIEWK